MADDIVKEEPKPVTNEHWHRVAGIIMLKLGFRSLELVPEDVLKLQDDHVVVADVRAGRFVVRIMDVTEVERIKREKGGITA